MEVNRGTESCPIDLTDDESPPKKLKTKISKHLKTVQSLHERLAPVERELSDLRKGKLTTSSSEGVVMLFDRCQNLENRISALENFVENVKQSFLTNIIDPDPIADQVKTQKVREIEASQSSPGTPNGASEDVADIEVQEGPCIDEASESASICSDETVLISKDVANSSGETILLGNNPTGSSDEAGPCGLNEDCMPAFGENSRESVNDYVGEREETECATNGAEDLVDIKPFSLPKVVSIKQELNLLRDDQGRVLLFLNCAAKRLHKNSSLIVGVSGMYLHDQLHNEFVFTSQRSMKDVKVEAEIRAALFGVETIRDLFSKSLGNVCVMVISSCTQLVQSMKAQKSFPNFYICSCQFRNCEHSESRWTSQETLGKSQVGILPDLILSMSTVRVHWCKVENISQEEKKVMDEYHNVVDSVLSEAVRQNKNSNSIPSSSML